MFYIPLYPEDTHNGEVVTYNGNGGVDAKDILYAYETITGGHRMALYSDGYDEAQLADTARFYFSVFDNTLTHTVNWQGSTAVPGDLPKVFFQPILPTGQDDGYTHLVFIGEQASSGSGEGAVYLDLDVGPGDELVRLQADVDHKGIRRTGTDYILEFQWETNEDVGIEHIVEAFRNKNKDYATPGTDINNNHQFRIYGRTDMMGYASVGNRDRSEQYVLPPGRPDPGVTLPAPADPNGRYLALWDNIGELMKWYTIIPGSGADVTYNAADQTIEIDCTCTGGPGGTSIDTDVVKSVQIDPSSRRLIVSYTQLTVQAEAASGIPESSIGNTVQVVIDNDVNGTNLRKNTRTLYVLDADGADGFSTWHVGTACP